MATTTMQNVVANFNLPTDAQEPAEWLRSQAGWYRSFGIPWATWLASQIERMADDVEFTGATNPEDVDVEISQMERVQAALENMEAIVKRARK